MDKEGFQRFISEINDLLHDFGMTIQRGREETKNGKGFLVLVRAVEDWCCDVKGLMIRSIARRTRSRRALPTLHPRSWDTSERS